MDAKILDDIITSKKNCYFVSPHFDDMVLSAGALATHLAKTNRIVAINVFTQAGPQPYTLSAKTYLSQCGYTDAEQLYRDRVKEDAIALAELANESHNLGFTDALWRPKTSRLAKSASKLLPELGVIYPTYRFHIAKGRIARADQATLQGIKAKLTQLIESDNSVVFCPLGVGGHIDHVITRTACDQLFNPIHWTDYPYSLSNREIPAEGMHSFSFSGNQAEKADLISKYDTQYKAMFSEGLNLKPETFFVKP